MRIYVCVKQVPDTSGTVAVNPDGTLNRASMQTIINPDDLAAMEQALLLKDDAILISAREFGGSDTFATSQIISAAITHTGLGEDDMIFSGRQAIDGDTAQVGPQIAEKLNLPQVSYAAEIKKEGSKVLVKRMLEDGYMMISTETPCLVTCINDQDMNPRYMTLNGIMDCYSKPLTVLDFEALKDEPLIELDKIGLKGSPTNIFTSFTPPQKGVGEMLEGANKDTAATLAAKLLEKHVI